MTLPNQLTLLRILLTPVFVFLLFFDSGTARIGAFFVFVIASLTDWYDGYTARKSGAVSMWGKFLDPLADKILVSSALICFSVLGYIPGWMVLIIVTRDLLITILRSYAILKNRPIVTNFFAKAKTFSQFVLIYLIFLLHLLRFSPFEPRWRSLIHWIEMTRLFYATMCVITLFTVVSGLIYIVVNRSHIREMGSDIIRIFIPSDIKE